MRHGCAAAVAAALAFAAPVLAEPAAPGPKAAATAAPSALDAAARRAVVDKAAKLLIEDYVFPEMGRRAAEAISQNLAEGRYDAITDPAAFAERLTEDLRSITHDVHMKVATAGRSPDPEGPKAPPNNQGFARADVLDGNIGYIDLVAFYFPDLFKVGADKAMRGVTDTDALIIDLRHNIGGNPASVAYLVSFFFDPKTPVHVNDLLWRKPGTDDYRRQVFQTEPTPVSYLGKPVVLITGPDTISGGEEFLYDLQTLKRATLVGEVSRGGANPAEAQDLGGGFIMGIPTGRAENPITHTNWEGRGVQPDVPAASAQAFAVAYKTALQAAQKPVPADARDGPDEVVATRLLTPRTTAQPGSEAAVRRTVAELAEGQPRYDLLSPTMAEMTRTQLARLHAEIAALGPLQSITFVMVDPMGVDTYDVKFAKGELVWHLLLGDDGKVLLAAFGPK